MKKRTEKSETFDFVNKTQSLKTIFVLQKSLNFVCPKLYEPCSRYNLWVIFEFEGFFQKWLESIFILKKKKHSPCMVNNTNAFITKFY